MTSQDRGVLVLSDTSALDLHVEAERSVFAAGERVVGEYHCADCGYGVAIRRELPLCPMCGSEQWQIATWSPFSRAQH